MPLLRKENKMTTARGKIVTGQTGEYLVAAELSRCGIAGG